jgi:hypothetical protein
MGDSRRFEPEIQAMGTESDFVAEAHELISKIVSKSFFY